MGEIIIPARFCRQEKCTLESLPLITPLSLFFSQGKCAENEGHIRHEWKGTVLNDVTPGFNSVDRKVREGQRERKMEREREGGEGRAREPGEGSVTFSSHSEHASVLAAKVLMAW